MQPMTHHARARSQQRSIPPVILDFLAAYGSSLRCGGAEYLVFDKSARKRLKRQLGGGRSLRPLEPWLSTYAVVSDEGVIITVGHRTRRLWRA